MATPLRIERWSSKPVILIGGGPSLRGFDFEGLLRLDAFVVGVNQAALDVTACIAGVTIDRIFVRERAKEIEFLAAENGLLFYVGLNDKAWENIPGTVRLANKIGNGLSADPNIIYGATSGHAALNLAVLKGAKQIILLGFDYWSNGNRHHYHDAYPWYSLSANEASWPLWALEFEQSARDLEALGVDVIAASPDGAALSNLNVFPRKVFNEAMRLFNLI